MDIIKKINYFLDHGIIFQYKGERLFAKSLYKTKMASSDREWIKNNKQNIITYLKKNELEPTKAQENMWFVEEVSKECNSSNNIIYAITIEGDIKKKLFEKSLDFVICKHKILKSNFIKDNSGDLLSKETVNIVSPFTWKENVENIDEDIESFINIPFNLKKDLPFRCAAFIKKTGQTELVFVFHHIIFDGWSLNIFIEDLTSAYNSLLKNNELKDIQNNIDFSSYKLWKKNVLNKNNKENIKYWQQKLAQCNTLIPSYRVLSGKDNTSCYSKVIFSKELTSQIIEFVNKEGVTLYQFMLSSIYILLTKYLSIFDLNILTPVANRPHESFQKVIGYMLNNVTLRINPVEKENTTFKQLINLNKKNLEEAITHSEYNFNELINKVCDERYTDRMPLAQVMYVHQNMKEPTEYSFGSYKQKRKYLKPNRTYFDLAFESRLLENQNQLQLIIQYSDNYFNKDSIKDFSTYLKLIISQVIPNSDLQIKDIDIVPAKQKQELLNYNLIQSDENYDDIITVFKKYVQKTPTAIAVEDSKSKLTYEELDKLSDNFASHILSKNKKGFVGICLDRNNNLLTTIIGVLKAGLAYVPIDKDFPDSRIQYIVNDTKMSLVVTESSYAKAFINKDLEVLISSDLYVENRDKISFPRINLESTAYVIYTSGTTGNPKGVKISRHSFIQFLQDFVSTMLTSHKQISCLSSTKPSFDIFGLEYGSCLITGGNCILVDTPNFVEKLLEKANAINMIQQTPSVWKVLLDGINVVNKNKNLFSNISALTGGEAASLNLLRDLDSNFAEVINVYGPTETTIWSSAHRFNRNDHKVSIGRALKNEQVYILDKNLKLVPKGFTGELFIGGRGLAQGYLNMMELTSERFIDNPLYISGTNSKKIYKTGDLARWDYDGLNYVGRTDSQIKIRGFRIEIGEIEAAIMSLDYVKRSVVIVSENPNNEKVLVAYVTFQEKNDKSILLNKDLAKALPEYMIPSFILSLEEFPLNSSGKVDIKSLPKVDFSNKKDGELAKTGIEKKLVELWKEYLNIDNVFINDDFFALGGNSILAIQLSNKISKILKQSITVGDIFECRNIKNLLLLNRENNVPEDFSLDKNDSGKAPLSSPQRQLYFFDKTENNKSVYHMPIVLELRSNINIVDLKLSIETTCLEHDILSSIIVEEDLNIYQKVIKSELPFRISDVEFKSKDALNKQIRNDISVPFLLNETWPIKVYIYKYKESYIMLLNIHHIAFDGWSMNIFIDSVQNNYKKISESNKPHNLNIIKPEHSYRDYSIWQKEFFKTHTYKKGLEYWKNKLDGVKNLDLASNRPAKFDYKGRSVTTSLDRDIAKQVHNIAIKQKVSSFSIYLAAFNILLYKYSNSEDITIGVPMSGRIDSKFQDTIGFFVNSVPLRNSISPDFKTVNLIDNINQILVKAQNKQNIPFEHIVREVNIERDPSFHPIFQVMFSVQSFGIQRQKEKSFYTRRLPFYDYLDTAKLDLALFIDDSPEISQINITYAESLFSKEYINDFVEGFSTILEQLAKNLETKVNEYDILSKAGYDKIIKDFNTNFENIDNLGNIIDFFNYQVKLNPDKVALIFKDERLTYKELDQKTNQLANYLIKHFNITKDYLVPLFFDRGLDMIIAILGVIKAGGAYIPIGIDMPDDRISFILQDSSAEIILSSSEYAKRLEIYQNIKRIFLDENNLIDSYSISSPNIVIEPNSLAYVIFTSGTTGKPKGVMLEHSNIANLINYKRSFVKKSDISCSFHSYTFDVSVMEFFTALSSGITLHILDKKLIRDISSLFKYIEQNDISLLTIPPKVLEQVSNEQIDNTLLRAIDLGGETYNGDYHGKKARLLNHYGPTETTVFSTTRTVYDKNFFNIGKAISNTKLYVLDKDLKPVPIGVAGELHISGAGVARGYLNRPELTKEKFIEHHLMTSDDKEYGYDRLYKTGDLVKWLPNGEIEYVGRTDFQVKIRGYRIELTEIENVILSIPEIIQVAVLAVDILGYKSLVAYYVSQTEYDDEYFSSLVQNKLPEYMIPSYFIHMKEFPLTINGKLDRNKLPKINTGNDKSYREPSTEVEKIFHSIFCKVLGVEKVSIDDNFFKIGGDSIKVMQIQSLAKQNGIFIKTIDVFTAKTITKLAKKYDSSIVKKNKTNSQVIESDIVPLLPIQKWFLYFGHKDPNWFNQSILIRVPCDVDIKILKRTVLSLQLTSETFALRFSFEDGVWKQKYLNKDNFKLKELNIHNYKSNKQIEEICTDLQSKLNILEGNIYSFDLFDHNENKYLLICLHHLITDGVSQRIIYNNLISIYDDLSSSKGLDMNKYKEISTYQEWSYFLKNKALGASQRTIEFWQEKSTGLKNVDADSFNNIHNSSITVSKDIVSKIKKIKDTTIKTQIQYIIIASFIQAYKQYSLQDKITIAFEGHGREELDSSLDISSTIGWFTNIFPLTFDLSEKGDIYSSTYLFIKYIESKFKDLGEDKGLSFSYLNHIFNNSTMFLNEKNIPISFNFLGEFVETDNNWKLENHLCVGHISHENLLPHPLSLNSYIKNGELYINIKASKNFIEKIQKSKFYKTDFSAESFINGVVYTCDIIKRKSKIIFSGITEYLHPCLDVADSAKKLGFILTDPNSEEYKKISKLAFKVEKILNIPDGVSHFEFFKDKKTKEIIFLEVGIRPGGACLPQIYELAYDINLHHEHFYSITGLDNSIDPNMTYKPILCVDILSPNKGIIKNFNIPKLNTKKPMIKYFYKKGDFVNKTSSIAEKLLNIAIVGNTESLDDFYKDVNSIDISNIVVLN
ncbi:non-ribosomal peptide synthetase [Francisella uliginis]|uniref:Non-ribosomal peptide synthetase n=1 Tax=Francisella uliginis TaxID=573570 RepID=A0A1L4BSJ1_9GAMM|nr:non-ribosomal peptide synthetase [Francisella uliginis]API86805.1 hypothetical protein F7310_05300 [Francisella uliginis]